VSRLFGGFFIFCRLQSADENTRLRSALAIYALHSANGYFGFAHGVHPANGNIGIVARLHAQPLTPIIEPFALVLEELRTGDRILLAGQLFCQCC